MLELILTVGNYMNSSAKTYEPVHGFDISFLPKVNFLSSLLIRSAGFSFIQPKPMMVGVHYFILSFKQSKINIEIYYHFPMNSIYLLMEFRKVSIERKRGDLQSNGLFSQYLGIAKATPGN